MSEKINVQDLVDSLAAKYGLDKKEAETFVKEFFWLIENGLEQDNYVKVKGLGTFKLIEVESRESVNVNTGERFKIEGHMKVSFTPDATLRDAVNKPFSHFETVILNDDTVLGDVVLEDMEEEQTEMVEESKPEIPVATPVEVKPEPVQEQRSLADEIIARELSNANKGNRRVEVEEAGTPAAETRPVTSLPDVPRNEKEKSSVGYLVIMIIVVLLICGGVVGYIYYPDFFSKQETQQPQSTTLQQEPALVVPVDTLHATNEKADTMAVQSIDEGRPEITVRTEQVPQSTNEMTIQGKNGSVIKLIDTKTVHKMAPGESLTGLAIRYYKNKDYWTYIVQYNSSIITNPDHVPVDTELKIPEVVVNNQ